MKKSYTILIVVLILTAVGILIIATTNFLGIDEAKSNIGKRDSAQSFYLSTACAEEALRVIKATPTFESAKIESAKNRRGIYSWTNITIQSSPVLRCSYQVINKNLPKYIKARSGIGSDVFPHNLEIKIIGVNPINISYWQEK